MSFVIVSHSFPMHQIRTVMANGKGNDTDALDSILEVLDGGKLQCVRGREGEKRKGGERQRAERTTETV